MANVIASAVTSAVTFTKSTDESATKTILQVVAPSTHQVKILRWAVFFNEETGDATPASPFLVEVGKHSSSDGTSSALSPKKVKPTTLTIQTAVNQTFTVNATMTDKLDLAYVNAQTGYEVIYPMGQEIVLDPSEALNLQVSSGAVLSTGSVNVVAKIWFEE